jgi:hypothetical protein
MHVAVKYQPTGRTKPGHRFERFLPCLNENEMLRNAQVF